ncbi:MAG: plastocyanin/azurin family copper-binding protein [Gemmatimonadota bacterium]
MVRDDRATAAGFFTWELVKVNRFMMGAVLGMVLVGCGKGEDSAKDNDDGKSAASVVAGPKLTGKIIEVEMITDEKGNRFEPSEISAEEGDVLRFELKVGVHNVHFVADSNPGVQGLPPASDMLQLPGQEFDVTVGFGKGKVVYFQCDPHAALGMIGHVTVR